ncbi:sulfurtransferase [Leeia sp. TBRC 13508]|uniref:Sulfurtransferase n=1 Tax=Leeia speluncae TaxID=2884804 RepID=A0ABS8D6Y9_9NEIS|nr:rhodanese-like domain-containing protein [Leeia speluncae]MCB6183408.1 sulfurtransferase [Leeia speluncae]
MQTITAPALSEWVKKESKPQLIDVREPWEFALCAIPGSINIPMQTIPSRLNDIEEGDIVTICHHGMRSYQVALYLENAGLGPVHNLTGGVEAWASEVDPTMAHY